jgi:hypothetical protein
VASGESLSRTSSARFLMIAPFVFSACARTFVSIATVVCGDGHDLRDRFAVARHHVRSAAAQQLRKVSIF